ncbi:VOC family protein [Salana multivorans]
MSEKLAHGVVSESVDARHWRVRLRSLCATFTSQDYALLADFTSAVAAVAADLDHHPDVLLRWGSVSITTTSHDVGGLTARDLELAARISTLADERGLGTATLAASTLEVAIDALDIPAVWPFWAAVLGYRATVTGEGETLDVDLTDPQGLGPTFWFQQMDAARPQRNRIHINVTVAHDEAQQRLAAALAAGGALVSEERAPSFWVLADAEGNEACICTWQARSSA